MIHINTYWPDDQLPIIFNALPCKYSTIGMQYKYKYWQIHKHKKSTKRKNRSMPPFSLKG